MARFAEDDYGRLLRSTAAAEGIDLTDAPRAAERTSVAIASVGDGAGATYEFDMDATADWQWTAAELRELSPATEVLHFGSIASWTPPGAGRIADLVEDVRAGCRVLISYDPNIRPAVAGARKGAVARMEQSVSRAHVVKASRDDAEWLYPDLPIRGAHSRRLPGPRCYLG